MLDALFEEDMELQDELEDMGEISDDGDDIIISTMDHRYNDANNPGLFDNEEEPDESGLTDEEKNAIMIAYLDDDIEDDIEDADYDDEVIDDIDDFDEV